MNGFFSSLSTEERKKVVLANGNGINWFPEIPTGWRITRFKNLFQEIYRYPTYYNIEYISDGIPEVRGEALTPEGFIMTLDDERYISNETNKSFPRTQLQLGDIVMSVRGTMGKIGVVDERYAGANITANLLRLSPDRRKVATNFLRWVMRSTYFDEALNCSAPQTTIKTITMPQLAKIPIALPVKNEQQRIAAYLDASCAAIDAAVAVKRRQLETLDGLVVGLINNAVTRGLEERQTLKQTGNVWLKEVPWTWDLVSLKRMSAIQTGLTLGKVYEGPLIERPYLRVANVQDGHLNLEDVTTIEVPEVVAHHVELSPGDVLMTEGGDLDKLGRGTIWNGEIPDCLHQNHIFAIRCYKYKLLPAFLAYLTASRYGRDYFEATGKRTTNLASTNSTKVGLFPIPRPSIAEQRAICQFLDVKLNQIAQIVNSIEFQIATLTAYRKSLIHECVTGQRQITESDVQRVAAQRKFDNLALTG